MEKLGEGGFGNVYKAVDVMLQREVALKLLRSELGSDAAFVERFRREARTLARLNHPNIANVYALLDRGDGIFMVMEYVCGDSLHQVLRARGALPLQDAVHIFRQTLEGIDYAHRCGIVHRDIKPANVMLTSDLRIKILDFGIAHVLGTAHLTLAGQIGGTAAYMSPEQIRGEQIDARTDIYSLGILLYMLLTGHPPFTGKSAYELMKSQVECAPPPLRSFSAEVPEHLEAAVMRALKKRPCDRFQSAGEFAGALSQGVTEVFPVDEKAGVKPRQRCTIETIMMASALPQVQDANAKERAVVKATASKADALGRLRQPTGSVMNHLHGWCAAATASIKARYVQRFGAIAIAALAIGLCAFTVLPASVREGAAGAASKDAQAPNPSTARRTGSPISRPGTERPKSVEATLPSSLPSTSTAPADDQKVPQSASRLPGRSLSIVRIRPNGQYASEMPSALEESRSAANDTAVNRFKRGELIDLLVMPSHDAYVHCYLHDEAQKIRRFFPNRFRRQALVRASTALRIPGSMRFQLLANDRGATETVACFATPHDVMSELPHEVVGKDFEPLALSSLEQVAAAYAKVAGISLAQEYFHVEVR